MCLLSSAFVYNEMRKSRRKNKENANFSFLIYWQKTSHVFIHSFAINFVVSVSFTPRVFLSYFLVWKSCHRFSSENINRIKNALFKTNLSFTLVRQFFRMFLPVIRTNSRTYLTVVDTLYRLSYEWRRLLCSSFDYPID